jgi:hypothetical protein
MKKILFKEVQKYSQGTRLFLILITHVSMIILFVYAIFQQIIKGRPFGDNPAPDWALFLLLGLMIVTLIGMLIMKLELWIDEEGIHYRFFPIVWKVKLIRKVEIQRYEIRKINAVLEYGGRGLRTGLGHKWGKGFIVSGNQGLQLYLTNGKKVLFSTERSQAVLYAMDEMMKKGSELNFK